MIAPSPWSTHDLELFGDGELHETRRAELADALRADPALRERLAAAARVDAVMRRALVGDSCVGAGQVRSSGALRILAMAAVLGLVVILVPWGRPRPSVPGHSAPTEAVAEAEPSFVRVLWSIPITAPAQGVPPARDPGATPAAVPEQVERALATGDADGAAKLLSSASPEIRAAAYRRLGDLIRSAAACERLLDSMEPSEQLAVCREWALDPRLRPVTFSRLARLGSNTELSAQYGAVLAALSEIPELRSWIRSYVGEPAPGVVRRRG